MKYPDLRQWPPWALRAAVLALVATIGLLDRWSGPEISTSVFYLFPVAVATWYSGGSWGRFVAVTSATVWYLADIMAGHTYTHPVIPVWNALVRLAFFLIVENLLSRLRLQLESQQRLAQTDGRTGLANPRWFMQLLEGEIARVRRNPRPLSLAYLDLDDFKAVNDRFGHSEGDRVLESVAKCLRTHTRDVDVVARLGGDEFALLLPETHQDQAREALAKLRRLLQEEVDAHEWDVGFSVGVVTSVSTPPDADALIRAADDLMYEVKRGGKHSSAFRILESPPSGKGP